MGELVSAAPEELRRFRDVAADTSGTLRRRAAALEGALRWLAQSNSAGIRHFPADLADRLRMHARALDALGEGTGAVGDAFASISAATVVLADQRTVTERLLEVAATVGAQSPQYPDEWPGLVSGANGCPAVSMPIYLGIGNDRGEREAFDEPLWATLQTECEPALLERTQTQTVLGLGGIGVALGPEILEARNRGGRRPAAQRGPRPAVPPNSPARVMPMPRQESPAWRELDSYRDGIRTNGERGRDRQYYEWDFTHGHIEVYDHNRDHIGVADAISGTLDRSAAVPGRRLEID